MINSYDRIVFSVNEKVVPLIGFKSTSGDCSTLLGRVGRLLVSRFMR